MLRNSDGSPCSTLTYIRRGMELGIPVQSPEFTPREECYMEERLQKVLASFGIASRRKAEELIESGKVTVNGKTATLGMKADPLRDHIKVSGKLLTMRESPVYFMFYKPEGVLTTLSVEEGRPTVGSFLRKIRERVYPVGRLDYRSEGLMILTNDGTLAHALMHPSRKIAKVYHVKVKGLPSDEKLDKLRAGVRLEDGKTLPALIRPLGAARTIQNTWLEVTIYEGRKRQIRRMFDKINHSVIKLKRVGIGGLRIGRLEPGDMRPLSPKEVTALKREAGIETFEED